jgi:hypothetical protein
LRFSYGNEYTNYRQSFPAAFCPTVRYYEANDAATANRVNPDGYAARGLPIVCKGVLRENVKKLGSFNNYKNSLFFAKKT